MSRIHVKVVRKFIPHRLLLTGAWHHLETAKERKEGYFWDWLGAILMSALCIEAIGNTYGEVLIPDWKDFESASPVAKLRLVATTCGIEPDFTKHPWATARQLIRFRNRIAHAKPQQLTVEGDYTDTTYEQVFHARPESATEKMITADFATQGYDAVKKIIEVLSTSIDPSTLVEVEMDGWSSHASAIKDEVT